MLKEFREFILKGNAFDLAVGVIIGAAFGGIVTSLVGDILMPPIGALMGNLNFTDYFVDLTALKAKAFGVSQLRFRLRMRPPSRRAMRSWPMASS